jgi:predicted DNA-binding transcriptional regulator YafY
MATDLERKLVLLTLLASSRYPLTRIEIFKKLPSFYAGSGRKADSAKKMFERDKAELADSGFDILAEPTDSGEVKYRLNKPSDFLDRNFLLTQEQAKALSDCLEDAVFAGQLPGIAIAALSKLLTFHAPFLEGPKTTSAKMDKENHTLHFALQAAGEEKAIEVEYPSKEEKMERRVFSPYGSFMQSGACYLAAWCHREKMPKVLALYKIGRIAFSPEAFHPKPDGLSIARDYAFTNRWVKDETLGQRIVLKVDPKKAKQILEQHKFSLLEHQKDGSVLAEFWVTNPKRFFRFVLQFGRHAKILEPVQYRKAFLGFLKAKI